VHVHVPGLDSTLLVHGTVRHEGEGKQSTAQMLACLGHERASNFRRVVCTATIQYCEAECDAVCGGTQMAIVIEQGLLRCMYSSSCSAHTGMPCIALDDDHCFEIQRTASVVGRPLIGIATECHECGSAFEIDGAYFVSDAVRMLYICVCFCAFSTQLYCTFVLLVQTLQIKHGRMSSRRLIALLQPW